MYSTVKLSRIKGRVSFGNKSRCSDNSLDRNKGFGKLRENYLQILVINGDPQGKKLAYLGKLDCRTGHALVSGLRLFKTYDGAECSKIMLLWKRGLPRLKFEKDHLCQPVQLEKQEVASTKRSDSSAQITEMEFVNQLCLNTMRCGHISSNVCSKESSIKRVYSATEINAHGVPPGTSLSTTIAQDAIDKCFIVQLPDITGSAQSSSGNVNSAEPIQVNYPPDHLRRWTKDHPGQHRMAYSLSSCYLTEDAGFKLCKCLIDMDRGIRIILANVTNKDMIILTDGCQNCFSEMGIFKHVSFVSQPEGFETKGAVGSRITLAKSWQHIRFVQIYVDDIIFRNLNDPIGAKPIFKKNELIISDVDDGKMLFFLDEKSCGMSRIQDEKYVGKCQFMGDRLNTMAEQNVPAQPPTRTDEQIALAITPVIPAHPFELPPSGNIVIDFVNELGYPEPVEIVSNIRVNYVYQPWRAILSLINQCLTGKTSGSDKPRTQFCKCSGESSLKLMLDHAS
ncbi:hypothetical protein Tco_0794470 [Tanacetum coccineum]